MQEKIQYFPFARVCFFYILLVYVSKKIITRTQATSLIRTPEYYSRMSTDHSCDSHVSFYERIIYYRRIFIQDSDLIFWD